MNIFTEVLDQIPMSDFVWPADAVAGGWRGVRRRPAFVAIAGRDIGAAAPTHRYHIILPPQWFHQNR